MLAIKTGIAAGTGGDISQDDLLTYSNAGVHWLTDFGFQGCYASGVTVPDDAPVANMAVPANASAVRIPTSAGQPIIANGGLDFRNVTEKATYLEIPASVASAISTFSQKFLFCGYFRMPTEQDWAENSGQENTFLNWSPTGSWTSQADIVSFRMTTNTDVPQIICNRQTSIGNSNGNLAISPVPDEVFGKPVQLSFWRDSSTEYFSLKTSVGRTTRSQAAGANNSETISALLGKIGILDAWGTISPQDLETRKMRFYRGFLEIPQTSGRDQLTVLEDDWIRTYPRIAE